MIWGDFCGFKKSRLGNKFPAELEDFKSFPQNSLKAFLLVKLVFDENSLVEQQVHPFPD